MRLTQDEFDILTGFASIIALTVSVGWLFHSIPAGAVTVSAIAFFLIYGKK